jgi:dephospho-CoA kinase
VAEIEKIRAAAQAAGDHFILIATDADPKIRYDRAMGRKSETDRIPFEKFLEQEQREMESTDPRKHNLVACRKLARFVLKNNGTVDQFRGALEACLRDLVALGVPVA